MTPLEYLFAKLTIAWAQFVKEVREASYVPEGASDPYWQRTLEVMASPVKAARLEAEAAEHTPLPVPATYSEKLEAAEERLHYRLSVVMAEAMVELGMAPSEVLHEWALALDAERLEALARG